MTWKAGAAVEAGNYVIIGIVSPEFRGEPQCLPVAPQLVQGAPDGLSGGVGPVFLSRDPLAFVDGGLRDAGRLLPDPRIGGQPLRRVAGYGAQQKRHARSIADSDTHRQSGLIFARVLGRGRPMGTLSPEFPLDEPDHHPPDVHIYTGSKQPWVPIPQDAPRFEEFYNIRKVWPESSLARMEPYWRDR